MKTYTRCPNCDRKMMSGRWAKYNPRLDGKQVCEDCYVEAQIARFRRG